MRCRWRTSSAIFSQQRRDQGQRGDEVGVAVALDHLRGHRRGLQIQARADPLFGFGADVARRCRLRPRFCRRAGLRRRLRRRSQIAAGFFVPDGEFQPEGDRLGMDAVGAADLHRMLEFEGAALEHFAQLARDRSSRIAEACCDLQRLRGIDDVIRGQPVMEPARCFGVPGGRHRSRRPPW